MAWSLPLDIITSFHNKKEERTCTMNQPIRKLTIKDLKPAAKLFARVFNEEPWNEPWTLQSSYKRLMDISLTPGYLGIGYFEDENGPLLGFIVGNEEQWINNKYFYLNEICVDTNAQISGIGTSLLEFLKVQLKQQAVAQIYLSTEKGHRKPAAFFQKTSLN